MRCNHERPDRRGRHVDEQIADVSDRSVGHLPVSTTRKRTVQSRASNTTLHTRPKAPSLVSREQSMSSLRLAIMFLVAFLTPDRWVARTVRSDAPVEVRRAFARAPGGHRLKVLTLNVPPLRERREDIVPLAKMLLAEERREELRLSPAAVRLLESYAWPGNVRELQNAIKHGAALARRQRHRRAAPA